jgi:hypothetical protein
MISAIHQIYLLKKLKRGECSPEEESLLFNDPLYASLHADR